MFDGRWREAVDRTTRPVGSGLARVGITADVLTATGLLTATATAVMIATGHFAWAAVLFALTGAHDLFDGPVAKAAGTASVRGAFFDSVSDRIADAVLLGGFTWYMQNRYGGHVTLLPLAILGVTALISYQRAKAESLGISARGGLMERAERMILLGTSLLYPPIMIPILWSLLVLTSATAIGRFVKVWNAAEGPAPTTRVVRTRTSPARVESRFRHWREGVAVRDRTSRVGEPIGRWRARRQEMPTSRSGRVRRARSNERLVRNGGRRSATSRRP